LTDIVVTLDNYRNSYEKLAKEIREGMNEGFSEGLVEGIKQGFVDGVKECRTVGFGNIDVKSTEEILKIAFGSASGEALGIAVRRTVSRKYKAKIGPSFRKKMKEACDKAVEDIKRSDFELDERFASEYQNRVSGSVKKIKESIGTAFGGIRRTLPVDEVFRNFFEGLQEELNRDLDMHLKACERRICKEIDNKIEKKRADHERH
jgi:hypothetical protein